MVGLALSMGATGLLAPRQGDSAGATESKLPEATPSVFHVAALPTNLNTELATGSPLSSQMVDYVVRPGQTLRQIAERYRIDIETLAAVNQLAPTATLKSGQVLKLPAEAAKINHSQLPELTGTDQVSQTLLQRNQALGELQQQRQKLKNSLVALRQGGSVGLVAGVDAAVLPAEPSVMQVESAQPLIESPAVSQGLVPSPVATLPSPVVSPAASLDLDWMHVGQSLVIPLATQPQGNPQTVPTLTPPPSLPQPVKVAHTIPAAETTAYQVNVGDTVAQIARAHNIPTSVLISVNRLSDPNVIFVGQVLKLPGVQPTDQTAQTAQIGGPVHESESVIPVSGSGNRLAAASAAFSAAPKQSGDQSFAAVPATVLPPSVPVEAPSSEARPESFGRDMYVQNLLSEVKAMREQRQQRPAPEPVATVPSNVAEGSSPVSLRSNVPVQFPVQPSAMPQALRPQALRSVRQPAVVATAPLGSENYEPLVKPITGRMVSPELPALPKADRFLPNGVMTGYIWPAKGVLTSGFGWRWGRMHRGIDIASDVGTPIHAAAAGVVQFAGWNSGGYGNMVEVRHSDGSMTRYAHMNAIYVQEGQQVGQADQIGEMGSTGYSTGPHLHFEVHPNGGDAVNPIAYLPAQ